MSVLQPGSIVGGRYRVERELAQGGFGAVYIAQHKVTEEKVALKVLWAHVLKSKDAVARLQFEATVAAKVGSEHIVRVLDAGFDDDLKMPYLVMELLKGKTLEAMVDHEGPMHPLEALSVLSQTASALDKAHSYRDASGSPRPIVHRDLKPENLFFARRESGEPCIKILDFGIAKVLSDTSKVSQEAKGTPLFMAHEQLVGAPIGPFTDVWALGLIAFYLMTGKSYWQAASNPDADINALFAELLTSSLEPPSIRASALSVEPPWQGAFDGWFLRCVERDTSKRFQSAGEAIRELATALEVIESTPDSPAMVKARTMLAVRYNLSQTAPPRTTPSQTHGNSSPEIAQARSQASRSEVPAVSQSQSTTGGASPNLMPLLYGAFALSAVAIGALVFALTRPPVQQTETRPPPTTTVATEPPPPPSTTATASASASSPPKAAPTPPPITKTGGKSTPGPTATTPPTVATPPTTTAPPTTAPPKTDPFADR